MVRLFALAFVIFTLVLPACTNSTEIRMLPTVHRVGSADYQVRYFVAAQDSVVQNPIPYVVVAQGEDDVQLAFIDNLGCAKMPAFQFAPVQDRDRKLSLHRFEPDPATATACTLNYRLVYDVVDPDALQVEFTTPGAEATVEEGAPSRRPRTLRVAYRRMLKTEFIRGIYEILPGVSESFRGVTPFWAGKGPVFACETLFGESCDQLDRENL